MCKIVVAEHKEIPYIVRFRYKSEDNINKCEKKVLNCELSVNFLGEKCGNNLNLLE